MNSYFFHDKEGVLRIEVTLGGDLGSLYLRAKRQSETVQREECEVCELAVQYEARVTRTTLQICALHNPHEDAAAKIANQYQWQFEKGAMAT